MDFDTYQRLAMRTALPAGQLDQDYHREKDLLIAGLGLAGEAGEVADEIKKFAGHGHPINLAKMKEELGDQLWYLARIAKWFNISLEDVAHSNLEKLHKRYPRGFNEEDSIRRSSGG